MKIDILIAVGRSGGVENVINQIGKYLAKHNHKIRLIQTMYEGESWVDEDYIEFKYLYWGLNTHDLNDFSKSYSEILNTTYTPDIILCAAIPLMCYVANSSIMGISPRPTIISWLHAPVSQYERAGYGGLEALSYANYHFSISETIKNDLAPLGTDKVIDVYNPVNCNKQIGGHVRATEMSNSLTFVGRIANEKHLETIINAISLTKSRWQLDVYGNRNEPLSNQLIAYSASIGLQNQINWHGWHSDPWSMIKNTNFLILASEYEGFPLVAIEALTNGLPVISTPVSGIIDLIKPGENGYLFPINDQTFLAQVLDNISNGMLPYPEAEKCHKAAAPYLKENALPDFEKKLIAIHQQK